MNNWLNSSRDLVNNLPKKIKEIRKAGLDEIQMGLEKISITNELEIETDYIKRLLDKEHSDDVINDEIVTISGGQLNRSLANLDSHTDELLGYANKSVEFQNEVHGLFIHSVPLAYSSSGTAVYNAASIEHRIQAITPDYSPTISDETPERLSDRDKQFKQLSELLSSYDSKFLSMLEGSEDAIHSKSPDHLSQASHSMRDLFQQIIEHLAPTNVIKTQPWFENTPGAPAGVSRRSRIRYMLYGSGENVDEEVIISLDDIADSAKSSLDLCIARAHEHDPTLTINEVKLAIDQGRFSLIKVLENYYQLRNK